METNSIDPLIDLEANRIINTLAAYYQVDYRTMELALHRAIVLSQSFGNVKKEVV